MELILWRHAEAEPGSPDLARPLTPKGMKQAAALARWLNAQLPKDARILVSPSVRTRSTADALGRHYDVAEAIAPGASVASLIATAGWPDAPGTVVLVGHNPTISDLAAQLLGGDPSEFSMRKGAAWWLTNRVREGEPAVLLKAAMAPGMARRDKRR